MNKIEINSYPMVNPSPVVLIGTEVEGSANYTTVGAFSVVCQAPVFYISMKKDHFGTKGIHENQCFSVNLPSADMTADTDYCGMISGSELDKSQLFTPFYDERAKAPMIKEAPMNYLCRVIQSTEVNDFEVFFGEIIAAFINEDCLTGDLPDPQKIDPIVLMGLNYYRLGDTAGKVFGEGKKRGKK